jgi:hypothetical protein
LEASDVVRVSGNSSFIKRDEKIQRKLSDEVFDMSSNPVLWPMLLHAIS